VPLLFRRPAGAVHEQGKAITTLPDGTLRTRDAKGAR